MIPLQVSLFAIALIDLWAAGIVGLIFLLREGGLLSFGVAITLFGTVFAVTYALALPLTVLQIEVAIYRQTHRT